MPTIPTTLIEGSMLHRKAINVNEIEHTDRYDDDSSMTGGSARSIVLSARNFGMDSVSVGSIESLTHAKGASANNIYNVYNSDEGGPPVMRTVRELVLDIETRAKAHRKRPAYLPSVDSLSANMMSWKGNSLDTVGTTNSTVDIIPCQQPLELILVMADERARKNVALKELKERKIEEEAERIDKIIHDKFHKAEKYQAIALKRQLQLNWLRLIAVGGFMGILQPKYSALMKDKRMFFIYFRAANRLRKVFLGWKDRVLNNRYSM